MRTLALWLLVATLVAACAPTATPIPPTLAPTATLIPPTLAPTPTPIPPTKSPASPTPASVEAPAVSGDDLIGIWWFPKWPVKVEFRADGTYRIFETTSQTRGDEALGSFTLEGGKLTLATSEPLCAALPAPTYEAYVTTQDGKPAWLRLQDTGSDACEIRRVAFAGRGKFLGP